MENTSDVKKIPPYAIDNSRGEIVIIVAEHYDGISRTEYYQDICIDMLRIYKSKGVKAWIELP